MGNINKKLTLLLIVTLSISMLSLPVLAQSSLVPPPSNSNISAPSVPVFAVQAIDSSNFNIIIQNQPFESFNESAQQEPVYLYYSVQVRNSSNDQWTELYDAFDGYPTQSAAQTTTIAINLQTGLQQGGHGNQLPVSSQFEVEVTAMIGWMGRQLTVSSPMALWVIYGKTSGWSSPKTVSLPTSSPSSTPIISSPSPLSTITPISTDGNGNLSTPFPLTTNAIALIVIVVLSAALVSLLFYRRYRKTDNFKQ